MEGAFMPEYIRKMLQSYITAGFFKFIIGKVFSVLTDGTQPFLSLKLISVVFTFNQDDKTKTHFLKIHAPWDVLSKTAEDMMMKMPIKVNIVHL